MRGDHQTHESGRAGRGAGCRASLRTASGRMVVLGHNQAGSPLTRPRSKRRVMPILELAPGCDDPVSGHYGPCEGTDLVVAQAEVDEG